MTDAPRPPQGRGQPRRTPAGPSRSNSPSNRRSKVIAGFEILQKLGEGAVGMVFKARQISMDRMVALKILLPDQAKDPAIKKRFLKEARVSANLNHLNIINGIDCGDVGGYTYFAMEYVDGRPVQEELREKGKLPADEAFDIVRQIVDALIYAQGLGLVHRDIKPDNIMLARDGLAKLCDLGLAKKVGAEGEASSSQSGLAVGTPHYISPEQARAEKNIDGRSDIYSLGGTFYHLLTGRTPFQGDKAMVIMAQHLTGKAPNPCDLEPKLPAGYGQIITMMMAKSPADRYSGAKELAEDLDAVQQGQRPSAASFRAPSSCALPRRVTRTGRLRTTGPQSPIRRTTGAQPPVRRSSGQRRRFGRGPGRPRR